MDRLRLKHVMAIPTLIQKQDPVPPLRTYFSAIALPLFALDPLRCGSNPSVSGTVRD